jgi:hypothetical protein
MYGALWRSLPGPVAVRLLLVLVLLVGVVAACFVWLFPAVAPYVPFNDQTVEESAP